MNWQERIYIQLIEDDDVETSPLHANQTQEIITSRKMGVRHPADRGKIRDISTRDLVKSISISPKKSEKVSEETGDIKRGGMQHTKPISKRALANMIERLRLHADRQRTAQKQTTFAFR